MSHRPPPEDRDTTLRFIGGLTGLLLVIWGLWWIVWEVAT